MRIRPAILLAALAALAGCGGSDDGAGGGPMLKEPTPAADDGGVAEGAREQRRSRGEGSGGGGGATRGKPGGGDAEAAESDGSSAGGTTPDKQPQEGVVGDDPRDGRVERVGPLTPSAKDEIEAVRATLREFIDRTNARDGGLCTELVTENYLRIVTSKSGNAAVEQCRRDISRSRATVRLNAIEGVRVTGDTALIQFTSSIGPNAARQIFRMVTRGRWKIDGPSS